MKEIDPVAKLDVVRRYALPESLHIPIAAKDKTAITRFVGDILADLSDCASDKAFLISVEMPSVINEKLAIWKIKNSNVLHKNLQVWVHVEYRNYAPVGVLRSAAVAWCCHLQLAAHGA